MKTDLSAPAVAALAKSVVPLAQLVLFDFAGGPMRLNTSAWDLTWSGQTWLGAHGIGTIEIIEDSPGEARGLRFELVPVDSTHLALALSEPLQGRAVEVYTAIFDDTTYQILGASLEWAGFMDVMPIQEQASEAKISLTAEHAGIELIRPRTLKYTAQDQARIDASDKGFEFVILQSDAQIVWPAASYFRR